MDYLDYLVMENRLMDISQETNMLLLMILILLLMLVIGKFAVMVYKITNVSMDRKIEEINKDK